MDVEDSLDYANFDDEDEEDVFLTPHSAKSAKKFSVKGNTIMCSGEKITLQPERFPEVSPARARLKAFRLAVRESSCLREQVLNDWKDSFCPDVGDDDCWLSPNKGNKKGKNYGYVQGSFKGFNHFALVHLVAAWHVSNGPETDELQASHLCGSSKCFNPAHLCWENASKNNQRKGCPGTIVDLEGRRFIACPHEPRCVGLIKLSDCERI